MIRYYIEEYWKVAIGVILVLALIIIGGIVMFGGGGTNSNKNTKKPATINDKAGKKKATDFANSLMNACADKQGTIGFKNKSGTIFFVTCKDKTKLTIDTSDPKYNHEPAKQMPLTKDNAPVPQK